MPNNNYNELMNVRICLKNDTSANWTERNPVLLGGELGIETDTNKMKIGNGTDTWADLPYAGADEAQIKALINQAEDDYYAVDATDDLTDAAAIAAGVVSPKKGDICVVKRVISGDKISYTGYNYNGENWCALDGNYDAENVYFSEDLVYTVAIGTLAKPASSATYPSAGKNVKQVLSGIMAKEEAAAVATNPSVSITSNNMKAYEVGTNVVVNYSFSTNAGSYKYAPTATGITFSDYSATLGTETKTDKNGSFTPIQITDSTNLVITGSCKQSASTVVPKSNLGNEDASKKIAAKDWTDLTKGTLSGYRAWFYGYKTAANKIEVSALDSAKIRALTAVNGSFPATISTTGMQQMFFAIPKGKKSSVSVANNTNGAPQTVTKITDISVEGANGYTSAAYDVWYVDNSAADGGSNTYKITVK